jgi:hypothetical protein
MSVPKLTLKYAQPLDRDRRQLFADKNLGTYPSVEEVRMVIEKWRNIWDDLNANDKVIKLLVEITGTSVQRDLELCVFGTGLKAMSAPLMMPITGKAGLISDDDFVETVIHELVHRFVGDKENNEGIENYWAAIREEYKDESIVTQNHIVVYAVLDLVLEQLFGAERAVDFMQPKNPEYRRAVDIVEEKGSQHLINQFRTHIK